MRRGRAAFGRDAARLRRDLLELEHVETLEKEEGLVRLVVYVTPAHKTDLKDAAHAARLPMSVYCRLVLAGRVPLPAPPRLNADGQQLLAILQRVASNLTQLRQHATGEPLARLARAGGELEQLARARDHLAERLELGQLPDVPAWLDKLDQPGRALNDLAGALNRGHAVAPAAWRQPLLDLALALGVADG